MNDAQGVVDEWVRTWLHVRDLTSTTLDGWPYVHVGSRTRETELICVNPGTAAFADLLRHVDGDPRAMLTVIADDVTAYRLLPLPEGVRIDRDDETLMSAALTRAPIPPLDPEMTFRWDVEPHRLTYVVESGDRVAAEGTVGVLDHVATFDAVETTPAFQRRGLGRHVMTTLTEQAMGRGATHGVLAATDQGRQLYLSLGWEPTLEMLSLMGTQPAS